MGVLGQEKSPYCVQPISANIIPTAVVCLHLHLVLTCVFPRMLIAGVNEISAVISVTHHVAFPFIYYCAFTA